ncbi:MAG: hypothetical protein M3M94_05695 [Actinomycetota bacterium]|nr:hypothetical protein [Actinomycetota bacterium]
MKKISALLASLCAALALTATASAASFGVADPTGAFAPDCGRAFFGMLNDVGYTQNRVAILWDATHPTTIVDGAALDLSVACARLHGIELVFDVSPLRARSLGESPAAIPQFVAFLELLARRYPLVTHYVVGNEPNLSRFMQPQFAPDGSIVSAALSAQMLAASYDALKAVNPSITVFGLGLSPRGNDDPHASSNVSTSPVRFIDALGKAYRESGRNRPIADGLAFHPYPPSNTAGLDAGYAWPNAGLANLDRVKQAWHDAFAGTAQPTFGAGSSFRFKLDEVGWQVGIVPESMHAYEGRENVTTTDEATQAQIYGDIVRRTSCDSSVEAVLFFDLIDERRLAGWQAGQIRADGTRRPSYEAVKRAIAETGGRCPGETTSWRPQTSVAAPTVQWGRLGRKPAYTKSWSFIASSAEDAAFTAGLYRAATRRSARTLAGRRPSARLVLAAKGRMKANYSRAVRFPSRRLKPGTYFYRLRLSAAMNPKRTSVVVSKTFRVLKARKRR